MFFRSVGVVLDRVLALTIISKVTPLLLHNAFFMSAGVVLVRVVRVLPLTIIGDCLKCSLFAAIGKVRLRHFHDVFFGIVGVVCDS